MNRGWVKITAIILAVLMALSGLSEAYLHLFTDKNSNLTFEIAVILFFYKYVEKSVFFCFVSLVIIQIYF